MAKPGKPQQRVQPAPLTSPTPPLTLPTPESPTVEASESDFGAMPAKETTDKPVASVPSISNIRKDMVQTRPKKPNAPTPKSGSLLPSAYQLEHLKAAVDAAGSTEKLLLILHHVEEAGGKSEVSENIETYRVLKAVLDEGIAEKVDA